MYNLLFFLNLLSILCWCLPDTQAILEGLMQWKIELMPNKELII